MSFPLHTVERPRWLLHSEGRGRRNLRKVTQVCVVVCARRGLRRRLVAVLHWSVRAAPLERACGIGGARRVEDCNVARQVL